MLARESVSVVAWLEHLLHPWSSFVIVPLFALANAGMVLSASTVSGRASRPGSPTACCVGLVVGKLVGIRVFAWLAVRIGIGVLPDGRRRPARSSARPRSAGIGFTVSIFVAGLAFDDPGLQDQAKIGILAASVTAALLGAAILARAGPGAPDPSEHEARRRV